MKILKIGKTNLYFINNLKILFLVISIFTYSCDNDDSSYQISLSLSQCSSSSDYINYSGNLYNCGDLMFLQDFSDSNSFYIDYNLINIGIQSWSYNGRLTELILFSEEFNSIDHIPHSISNLNYIELLDLSGKPNTNGNISFLPDNIENLQYLEELYLNNNSMIRLPENIGSLSSLKILWLNNNILEYLPTSICNLDASCEIKLEKNNLCNEFNFSCFENFSNFTWDWQNISNQECR